MSGIDDLKRLNAHLGALLADPHPGLSTWRTALSETLTQMSDYAGHGKMSLFPELLETSKAVLNFRNECREWEALHDAIIRAEGAR